VRDDLRLWVVDTSSLIQIREAGLPTQRQTAVFRKLTELAEGGRLIFPPQVREELERSDRDHSDDAAIAWVKRTKVLAERPADMDTVLRVLARAPLLIDPNLTRDQADPYVIALAMDTQDLGGVSILADDRHDQRDGRGGFRKLSIATVGASWDIPVVPLQGFILKFFAPT
jgi:hypothetical protein